MDKATRELINDIYKRGVSLEEIKNEFQRSQDAAAAEKKKAEQLKKQKIEKARKEFLATLANYIELVDSNYKVSREELDEIEKSLIQIENLMCELMRKEKNIHPTREKNEDAILSFLKVLGVD